MTVHYTTRVHDRVYEFVAGIINGLTIWAKFVFPAAIEYCQVTFVLLATTCGWLCDSDQDDIHSPYIILVLCSRFLETLISNLLLGIVTVREFYDVFRNIIHCLHHLPYTTIHF